MIETNTRTLAVLLASFVALVMVIQSAHRASNSAPVNYQALADKAIEAVKIEVPVVKKVSNQLMAIPAEKCASTWVNGGNYVLVTPTACNDVSIASIKIGVSAKPCETSTKADFESLTNSTAFKGDYGFYLGQGKAVQCVAVQEILGKYL